MKNRRRFSASSLVTTALVAAVIFGGAAQAVAQSDSTTSGDQTRYPREAISSTPPAVTFKTLVNFDGTNGSQPGLSPIQGTDGNLYGGTADGGKYGQGVLFKMTPAGTLTPLYDFCAQSGCPDGEGGAPEVLGMDGNFYGSTGDGGASGYGTIFKFTEQGNLTTLHNFDNTDGSGIKHLVQGSSSNFYGTTSNGGNLSECFGIGCGTVFKMTAKGTLTTLYDFCSKSGCDDGAVLYDALKQGPDGNYYGTTWGGGPADGGTVFKITPKGKLTTIYSFCVKSYPFCGDGNSPIALVLGADGNFYGTTAYGGAYGEGSVYQITTSGTLTTIYSFRTQIACTDGATPRDGLVLGSDGNFYGATYYGGTDNQGTLYEISPAGALNTLHSFDGTDGRYPIQHLFQATNGVFYGVTNNDGTSGDGTIFSLSVGLEPCVETAPVSGSAGTKVIILGNKLKGTTKVTFNGTAAVFKVVSPTEITTTVPSGATTGLVRVTTPSRTLTSNVSFLVP
jgi:uncharacterized repeat protein (TIGR03803 family)